MNKAITLGAAIAMLSAPAGSNDYVATAREGWNGKGMAVVYVPSTTVDLKEGTPYAEALGGTYIDVTIDAHLDMYTAGKTFQPGWLASQADLLASDWALLKKGDLS